VNEAGYFVPDHENKGPVWVRTVLTATVADMRRILAAFIAFCLSWPVVGNLCRGQEFFPGNIFELRPPHVRVSEGTESFTNPRGGQWFGYMEAPPAIPAQNDIRLTDEDMLSLVYPASNGSFYSGGSVLLDRLRVNGAELELDVFHFTSLFGPIGNALVPPRENSLFIGRLSAGEHTVNTRNWYLPWDTLSHFDPEKFEPPANAIMPNGQLFATPVASDDPPVFIASSFQFVVFSVPEPSSIMLIVVGMIAMIWSGMRRKGCN
jgi:hypothetical protein